MEHHDMNYVAFGLILIFVEIILFGLILLLKWLNQTWSTQKIEASLLGRLYKSVKDSFVHFMVSKSFSKPVLRESLVPKTLTFAGNALGAGLWLGELGFSSGAVTTAGIVLMVATTAASIFMPAVWAIGGKLRSAQIASGTILPVTAIINHVLLFLPLGVGWVVWPVVAPFIYFLVVYSWEYEVVYEKNKAQLAP